MDERRRSERQPSLLRGRVYFNSGRCSLDCLIRDISYEGARIVFSDPVSIPDVIRLAIPKKNRMMDATVRWRRGLAVGVVFTQLVPGVVVERLPTGSADGRGGVLEGACLRPW
jgi:PilZ domain